MDKIQEQWPEWQAEELLGKGTFGEVYKAKKEVYGNVSYAAIKVIEIPKDPSEVRDLQQSDMDENSIQTFYEDMIHNLMSEIQIMESMKSANGIVGIEDYKVVRKGPIKWEIFIRMELLTDLQSYLEKHPMTGREVVKLGLDICEALKNCAIAGVVHRDVKTDNIFVNSFGSFKLGDFGIAKQLGSSLSAMSQKGTNMYMAPEVYRGEPYDARVDIYSLGILLYRMFNRCRFPFMPLWPEPIRYTDDQKATFQRLSGKKIPPIQNIPEGLSDIVLKACAYDKEMRYQTARELQRDLEKYADSPELEDIVTKGKKDKAVEIEEPPEKKPAEDHRDVVPPEIPKEDRAESRKEIQPRQEPVKEEEQNTSEMAQVRICPRCGGKGVIQVRGKTESGMTYMPQTCPECQGTGKVNASSMSLSEFADEKTYAAFGFASRFPEKKKQIAEPNKPEKKEPEKEKKPEGKELSSGEGSASKLHKQSPIDWKDEPIFVDEERRKVNIKKIAGDISGENSGSFSGGDQKEKSGAWQQFMMHFRK